MSMFSIFSYRFGIDVSETTLSQKKRNSRLKQQGILQYVKGSNPADGTSSEGKPLTSSGRMRNLEMDVDLELAKALSLETKRLEDEQRPKRTEPRTPLKKLLEDESLDNLPRVKVEVGHKFVDSPVRKKAERKVLPAFECAGNIFHISSPHYALVILNKVELSMITGKFRF
jgi:hypothetical protein